MNSARSTKRTSRFGTEVIPKDTNHLLWDPKASDGAAGVAHFSLAPSVSNELESTWDMSLDRIYVTGLDSPGE